MPQRLRGAKKLDGFLENSDKDDSFSLKFFPVSVFVTGHLRQPLHVFLPLWPI
jgi:hypothetical protein